MAFYDGCSTFTAEAGTAVTIGRFVTLAADGQWDHAGTAQGRVDGICAMSQATVGGKFPVVKPDGSLAKVEAGAAITRGDVVATDTSGRAITRTASNGDLGWGVATEAATAAGQFITIQFAHKGQVNA